MKKIDELKLESVKSFLNKLLKNSWSITVIALAISSGWYGRGLYDKVSETSDAVKNTLQHPTKTIDKTSVAVNEREELIIFDRETGDYTDYDKEVRFAIFNQQFTKIQSDFKNKN